MEHRRFWESMIPGLCADMPLRPNGGLMSSEGLIECIPDTDTEELIWLLPIDPNPSEGLMPGEPSEGLMTENGEPKMLVGLLEAELVGCCEDMAITLPSAVEERRRTQLMI